MELLVAIAVIALLAGLILPSLSNARESGRRAKCLSNLHQMAIAALIYTDDNNAYLPPFFGGTIVATGGGNGAHLKVHTRGKWSMPSCMGPINNLNLLVCPSDRKPVTISTADLSGNAIQVPSSYTFNFEMYLTATRVTEVQPPKTLLVYDGNANNDLQVGVWYANVNPAKKYKDADRLNTGSITRRHLGKFNAVFVDAHAETLTTISPDSLLANWQ